MKDDQNKQAPFNGPLLESLATPKGDLTVNLRYPPQNGEQVLSLEMHVTTTPQPAKFAADSFSSFALADANGTVQPITQYGILQSCQPCTLFMTVGSGIVPAARPGKDVTVKAVQSTVGGKPIVTIVIS